MVLPGGAISSCPRCRDTASLDIGTIGISEDGAVVVVRPDQYVAGIFPLGDTAEIEEFLSGVFPSVRSAAMINV